MFSCNQPKLCLKPPNFALTYQIFSRNQPKLCLKPPNFALTHQMFSCNQPKLCLKPPNFALTLQMLILTNLTCRSTILLPYTFPFITWAPVVKAFSTHFTATSAKKSWLSWLQWNGHKTSMTSHGRFSRTSTSKSVWNWKGDWNRLPTAIYKLNQWTGVYLCTSSFKMQ